MDRAPLAVMEAVAWAPLWFLARSEVAAVVAAVGDVAHPTRAARMEGFDALGDGATAQSSARPLRSRAHVLRAITAATPAASADWTWQGHHCEPSSAFLRRLVAEAHSGSSEEAALLPPEVWAEGKTAVVAAWCRRGRAPAVVGASTVPRVPGIRTMVLNAPHGAHHAHCLLPCLPPPTFLASRSDLLRSGTDAIAVDATVADAAVVDATAADGPATAEPAADGTAADEPALDAAVVDATATDVTATGAIAVGAIVAPGAADANAESGGAATPGAAPGGTATPGAAGATAMPDGTATTNEPAVDATVASAAASAATDMIAALGATDAIVVDATGVGGSATGGTAVGGIVVPGAADATVAPVHRIRRNPPPARPASVSTPPLPVRPTATPLFVPATDASTMHVAATDPTAASGAAGATATDVLQTAPAPPEVLPAARPTAVPEPPQAAGSTVRSLLAMGVPAADDLIVVVTSLVEFSGQLGDASRDVMALAECVNLRELCLTQTRICPLRVQHAAWKTVLRRLSALVLDSCDLTPRTHLLAPPHAVLEEVWAVNPTLARLGLMFNRAPRITDAFLQGALTHARSLTDLALGGTAITDVGMGWLMRRFGASLRSLSVMDGRHNITDGTPSAIAASGARLAVLRLEDCSSVTDAGVGALCTSPSLVATLTTLVLNGCTLVVPSTLTLLRAGLPALRHLSVQGCHGLTADAAALAELRTSGVSVAYRPPLTTRATVRPTNGAALPQPPAGAGAGAAGAGMSAALVACPWGCRAVVRTLDVADHGDVCAAFPHHACPCAPCPFTGTRVAVTRHMVACPRWLVACPHGCQRMLHRSHVMEHVQIDHVARAEQEGLASGCPALVDGCTVCFGPPLLPLVEARFRPLATPISAALPPPPACGPGSRTPYTAAAEHIFGTAATRSCPLLQYVCASCGAPCERRQASCGTAECHNAGVRRCAMPHLLHWAEKPPTPDIVTRWRGEEGAAGGAGAGGTT